MMTDEFKTLRDRRRVEVKVRGSRFIATAMPAQRKDEAERLIAEIRSEFHDASHNPYAYRLGTDANEFRFHDDGEPSGTAGRPILGRIDTFGLTDVVVIVTRYFGGTKLGVGGLIRAYADAAERALGAATHLTCYKTKTFKASFPHSQISNVMHAVSIIGAKIVDTAYDEEVHVSLEVRESKAQDLEALLVNQTSGNIRLRSRQHRDA